MKNFETILADAGITVTDEQKKAISDGVKENYKPIADYNNQVEKIKNLDDKVKSTEEALKAFDGVDEFQHLFLCTFPLKNRQKSCYTI